MRIAVVTTSYPAFPGDPCGHFVETESRELADGADVVVLTPGNGGDTRTIERGVTVWRLDGGDAFGWPGVAARVRERPGRLVFAAAWMARARRQLAALPTFDRVVAHWAVPSAFPVACTGSRRVPVDVVSHGADVRLLLRLPAVARHAVVGRILRCASSWRFVSSTLANDLAASLGPRDAASLREKTCVKPASIEILPAGERSAALRRESGEGPLLVCVGRLVPSKRFERALDRVAEARARVVIVGDGPERGRLESHARALGLQARFVGKTSREDALAWIGAADALVHASLTEGLSTVVREAEVLGVRVILVD
jgi:teichuronic acid biosynthesis glycosyltransferase TuaC